MAASKERLVEDEFQFRICLGLIATGCLSFISLLFLSDVSRQVNDSIQMLSDNWLDGLSQTQREEWIWAERKESDRIFPETLLAEQLSRRYREGRVEYIRQNGDDPYSQRDVLRRLMVPPVGGFLLGIGGIFLLPGSLRRIS